MFFLELLIACFFISLIFYYPTFPHMHYVTSLTTIKIISQYYLLRLGPGLDSLDPCFIVLPGTCVGNHSRSSFHCLHVLPGSCRFWGLTLFLWRSVAFWESLHWTHFILFLEGAAYSYHQHTLCSEMSLSIVTFYKGFQVFIFSQISLFFSLEFF